MSGSKWPQSPPAASGRNQGPGISWPTTWTLAAPAS